MDKQVPLAYKDSVLLYVKQVRARNAVSLACSAALLVACGSTAGEHRQPAGAAPAGTDGVSGAIGPSTGAAAPGQLQLPGAVQIRPSGSASHVLQKAGPATTTSGPAGSVSTRIPARGPGITNSTIYLGVAYNSQRSATAAALGAAGAASTYDIRDVVNAVIRYANSHGGFAGRKLQAVFSDSNGADAQTADAQACATLTQDHRVFAFPGGSDARDTCAERAHTVPIGAGSATATTYQHFPHLVDPDTMRLDRLAAVTVSGLSRAGYFTGKLGLVTWDQPDYRYAMQRGYLRALAAAHVTPVDIAYLSPPQSPGALPDMASAVASYVNKFKSEGIDHVIIQDGPAGFCADGCQTLVWMNQAKSQQWYPRYGQNSHNAPGSTVMPSDQMDHALAVDSSDTDAANDAGWHPNAARERCFKVQADAGYPVKGNAIDEAFAALYCDQVFFLQRVINSLAVLDADSFVEAVPSLGKSFPTAFVYGSKFESGRRDGAGMVRTEEYFDSCKCLKYQGPPYDPD